MFCPRLFCAPFSCGVVQFRFCCHHDGCPLSVLSDGFRDFASFLPHKQRRILRRVLYRPLCIDYRFSLVVAESSGWVDPAESVEQEVGWGWEGVWILPRLHVFHESGIDVKEEGEVVEEVAVGEEEEGEGEGEQPGGRAAWEAL